MDLDIQGVQTTILNHLTWQDIEIGATGSIVSKMEQKEWSISQSFEELQSWNSESELITPKYFTSNYFGDMVAILDLGAGPLSQPLPLVRLFLKLS